MRFCLVIVIQFVITKFFILVSIYFYIVQHIFSSTTLLVQMTNTRGSIIALLTLNSYALRWRVMFSLTSVLAFQLSPILSDAVQGDDSCTGQVCLPFRFVFNLHLYEVFRQILVCGSGCDVSCDMFIPFRFQNCIVFMRFSKRLNDIAGIKNISFYPAG